MNILHHSLVLCCVAGFAPSVPLSARPPLHFWEESSRPVEPDTRSAECLRAHGEARVHQRDREPAKALDAIRRARAADPECQAARLLEAGLLADRGDVESALRAYRDLVEKGMQTPPGERAAWGRMAAEAEGALHTALDEPAAAARAWSDALRLDPDRRHGTVEEPTLNLARASLAGKDTASALLLESLSRHERTRGDIAHRPSDLTSDGTQRDDFHLIARGPAKAPSVPGFALPPASGSVQPLEVRGGDLPASWAVGPILADGESLAVFWSDLPRLTLIHPDGRAETRPAEIPRGAAAAAAWDDGWVVAPVASPELVFLARDGRRVASMALESPADSLAVCRETRRVFCAVQGMLVAADPATGTTRSSRVPAHRVICDERTRTLHTLRGMTRADDREDNLLLHCLAAIRGLSSIENHSVLIQCLYDDWAVATPVSLRARACRAPLALDATTDGALVVVAGGPNPTATLPASASVFGTHRLPVANALLLPESRPVEGAAFDPASRRLALSGPAGLAVQPHGPGGAAEPQWIPGAFGSRVAWSADGGLLAAAGPTNRNLRVFASTPDPARVESARRLAELDRIRISAARARAETTGARRPPVKAPPARDWLRAFAPASDLEQAKRAARAALEGPEGDEPPPWRETEVHGGESDPARRALADLDKIQDMPAGVGLFRLRKILAEHPAHAPARLRLAEFQLQAREEAGAISNLLEVVRADAGQTRLTLDALETLAAAHAHAGHPAESLDCVAAAYRLHPGAGPARHHAHRLFRSHDLPVPPSEDAREAELRWAKAPASPPPPALQLPGPEADAPRLDARGVYLSAAPFTVVVKAGWGGGSGVVLSTNGWILTNHHVVEEARGRLDVQFYAVREGELVKSTLLPARLVFWDARQDIALLRTEGIPPSAASARLAEGDPAPGATVYAIGSPGMWGTVLDQTITEGIVSASRRELADGFAGLQHTAAVNQGNSGGPLVSETGAVVGVNTRKSWLENVGFAVTATRIREILAPPAPAPAP